MFLDIVRRPLIFMPTKAIIYLSSQPLMHIPLEKDGHLGYSEDMSVEDLFVPGRSKRYLKTSSY